MRGDHISIGLYIMSLTLNLYLNTVSWLLNSWFHGFTVWRKVVSIQGLIVHFIRMHRVLRTTFSTDFQFHSVSGKEVSARYLWNGGPSRTGQHRDHRYFKPWAAPEPWVPVRDKMERGSPSPVQNKKILWFWSGPVIELRSNFPEVLVSGPLKTYSTNQKAEIECISSSSF